MILIIKIAFLIILISIYPNSFVIASDPYSGPDDEKTILAAEEAVKQLGKERGAILIRHRTVDIAGFNAKISSKSIDVEET